MAWQNNVPFHIKNSLFDGKSQFSVSKCVIDRNDPLQDHRFKNIFWVVVGNGKQAKRPATIKTNYASNNEKKSVKKMMTMRRANKAEIMNT